MAMVKAATTLLGHSVVKRRFHFHGIVVAVHKCRISVWSGHLQVRTDVSFQSFAREVNRMRNDHSLADKEEPQHTDTRNTRTFVKQSESRTDQQNLSRDHSLRSFSSEHSQIIPTTDNSLGLLNNVR